MLAIKGLGSTTLSFRRALRRCAAAIGIDVAWLAAVIAFETAYTFASDIVSGGKRYRGSVDDGKAIGLIQFTNVALKAMSSRGWKISKGELARLSPEEQLIWVQRYFETVGAVGRMHDVGDVYMAVFAPIAVGKSDATVLYSEPSSAYRANSALDRNKDGTITRGEAIAGVQYILASAKHRDPIDDGGDAIDDVTFPDGVASRSSGGVTDSVTDGVTDSVSLSAINEQLDNAKRDICSRLDLVIESLRVAGTA